MDACNHCFVWVLCFETSNGILQLNLRVFLWTPIHTPVLSFFRLCGHWYCWRLEVLEYAITGSLLGATRIRLRTYLNKLCSWGEIDLVVMC